MGGNYVKLLSLISAALVAATAIPATAAELSDGKVKIGVLNDQSSLYADLSGPGSTLAAQMAVKESGMAAKG